MKEKTNEWSFKRMNISINKRTMEWTNKWNVNRALVHGKGMMLKKRNERIEMNKWANEKINIVMYKWKENGMKKWMNEEMDE